MPIFWELEILYDAFKTSLKAEINEDIWTTLRNRLLPPLRQARFRSYYRKGYQPLGGEVMKVFRV
jgi:hypothetical protein